MFKRCYQKSFTLEDIWGSKVAKKVDFFAWIVALGKILTLILLGGIWPWSIGAVCAGAVFNQWTIFASLLSSS